MAEAKPAVQPIVLGGGISGLSTAIVLQSLGLHPRILTNYRPLQIDSRNGGGAAYLPAGSRRSQGDSRRLQADSRSVPTDYAMASAYPHNLRVNNLETVSDQSQAVFRFFSKIPDSGVSTYRLFEVFENEPEDPPLSSRRMNFQLFDGKSEKIKVSLGAPARPGAGHLWGWVFDTYFADMPIYLEYLWQVFLSGGGVVQEIQLSNDELIAGLLNDPNNVIVNCLGYGAPGIFGDRVEHVIVRGKQVHIPRAPLIRGQDGIPLAYNYTPTADVFSRADGGPEYVHFFPRQDGWLLGQTREPGLFDEDGIWHGQEVLAESIELNGFEIPEPIISLNNSLLEEFAGVTLRDCQKVGREGFRYYRDPLNQGVRLESEDSGNRAVLVHNYGHGGSGITMSWGCALQCAEIVVGKIGLQARSVQNDGLFISGSADDTLVQSLLSNLSRY